MTCGPCQREVPLAKSHIVPEFPYKPHYDAATRRSRGAFSWMQSSAMQGLFLPAGLALVVAGPNGSASLAVGGGLIVLVVVSRLAGRRSE